jgi:hypothetical protein
MRTLGRRLQRLEARRAPADTCRRCGRQHVADLATLMVHYQEGDAAAICGCRCCPPWGHSPS